jgi:exopolysaccharide biosynthesis polyprenyl glycosylphosphotransferase
MALPLQLKEHKILLFVVDLVLVNAAAFVAFWVHARLAGEAFDMAFLGDRWSLFLLPSVLWIVSLFVNDLYNLAKTSDFIAGVRSLVLTTAMVIFAYMVIFFFASPTRTLLRKVVLYQGAIGFALVGGWRLLYGFLIQYPAFSRKVVIVGAGWSGRTIAQVIKEHVNPHYQVLGFVDDDPNKQGKDITISEGNSKRSASENGKDKLPVLGTRKELRRLVKGYNVSEVILAITHDLHAELVEALLDCQSLGVQVTLMPVLYERITGRVPIRHIGDNWYVALPVDHPGTSGIYPLVKRALDIIGALIGLALYAPLFPFLALALYMDSPGPIFYLQKRVGKGGKVFRLIKLRTMLPNADKAGTAWTGEKDPRVTRVGRFLRKTRLDEFPQLINILKGDMSAVGPRAWAKDQIVAQKLEEQVPFYRLRNAVRPGMAGWAQVNYSHVTSAEDARIALEYDLYYIKHQSLWLDILIILKMIGKMLLLRGR